MCTVHYTMKIRVTWWFCIRNNTILKLKKNFNFFDILQNKKIDLDLPNGLIIFQ